MEDLISTGTVESLAFKAIPFAAYTTWKFLCSTCSQAFTLL